MRGCPQTSLCTRRKRGAWNETLLALERSPTPDPEKLTSLSVTELPRCIAWPPAPAPAYESRELLPVTASFASAVWRTSSAATFDWTEGRMIRSRLVEALRRSPRERVDGREGDGDLTTLRRGEGGWTGERGAATIGGVGVTLRTGVDLAVVGLASSTPSDLWESVGDGARARDLDEGRLAMTPDVRLRGDEAETCLTIE